MGPGFAGVAEVGVPDDAFPIEFESRPKSTTQHKGSDATLKDGAVPGIPRLYFLSIRARPFFEAPVRFTILSAAKIVVICFKYRRLMS
jgi:hypothetical protein